jgi:hypothetical protein
VLAADAPAAPLWRVFPWDSAAAPGAPFAADMVPRWQGSGRFDLPELSAVWYFAESVVHAVSETLQGFRGQTLDDADLLRGGHRLAAVPAAVASDVAARVVDLCDPAELARRSIRPDRLASRQLAVTQRIARQLAEEGVPGFRWWSSIHGDWHATVLFAARLPAGALTFGTPRPLTADDPAVTNACRLLGIRRGRARPSSGRRPAR